MPVTLAVARAAIAIPVAPVVPAAGDRNKDPFDRAILVTAVAHGLQLITADAHLRRDHAEHCRW